MARVPGRPPACRVAPAASRSRGRRWPKRWLSAGDQLIPAAGAAQQLGVAWSQPAGALPRFSFGGVDRRGSAWRGDKTRSDNASHSTNLPTLSDDPTLPPPDPLRRHSRSFRGARSTVLIATSGGCFVAIRLVRDGSARGGDRRQAQRFRVPGLAAPSRAALTASSIRILIHPATGLRSRWASLTTCA